MDNWTGLAMGLALMGEEEQPCNICGDVHEGTCEAEDLGNYADPKFEANGRYSA
jgi:hypothetical protein